MFSKQHPTYKLYKHPVFTYDEFSCSSNGFFNFISNIVMISPKHLLHNLQEILEGFYKIPPLKGFFRKYYGEPEFDELMQDVSFLAEHIINLEFPYIMDAIGVVTKVTENDDYVNKFLAEKNIGFTCSWQYNQEIKWSPREGTILPFIDHLTNRGKAKSGFFATVTQYEEKETGKKFALKRLKSEYHENKPYKRRFRREITILKRLKKIGHPNIVSLIEYNYDEESNDYWYIMPYASTSLHEYIKKYNSNLDIEYRIRFFEQILDAIELAHSLDILHRDLSSFNVLLNDAEQIWVSDFGLGKDYSNLSYQGYSAGPGYGSIMYVAPEQQDNLESATKKSDVYSLGKLLYFILTGKDPRIVSDSPYYSPVINKATLEEPSGRYKDAAEFKQEFLKYKALYEKVGANTIKTVSDLVLQKKEFDWTEFHEVVLRAASVEHIYYDFLDPVLSTLDTTDKIKSYISVIGNDIQNFTKLYVEKLQECYETTGWPFSSINSFGYFLNRLFEAMIDYPQSRLIILKELWYMSTTLNQWAVQDIVVNLIKYDKISKSIELDFSIFILESEKSFDKLKRINLTNKTGSLKNALATLR